MAAFVGFVQEEDQVLELTQYIQSVLVKQKTSNADSFKQECEQLLEENKNFELLEKLQKQFEFIWIHGSEKEIENSYFIFVSLLLKLGTESTSKLLPAFRDQVASNVSDNSKSLLRLKM